MSVECRNDRERDVWARAWSRSLAKGEDHGYAAHVADLAVVRERERRHAERTRREGE